MKNLIELKQHENEYITKLEKQLQIKEDLLLQNIKLASLGELLKNITHQWRQPLAIISAVGCSIDFKQKMGVLNENDINKSLNSINKNITLLTNTINDFSILFDDSIYKSHFDLYRSFKYVVDILQPQLYDTNIELNIIFDSQEIYTYKSELMQVFMHILNNSIEIFSHSKQKENYIFAKLGEENNNIIIQIYDNANGIEQEHISEVFNLWFSTKGKNGSGSGLYMCKKIIEEKLNGKIWVNNHTYTYKDKSYNGALFSIEIPIEVANKEELQYNFV